MKHVSCNMFCRCVPRLKVCLHLPHLLNFVAQLHQIWLNNRSWVTKSYNQSHSHLCDISFFHTILYQINVLQRMNMTWQNIKVDWWFTSILCNDMPKIIQLLWCRPTSGDRIFQMNDSIWPTKVVHCTDYIDKNHLRSWMKSNDKNWISVDAPLDP